MKTAKFETDDLVLAVILARVTPLDRRSLVNAIAGLKTISRNLHRLDESACNRPATAREANREARLEARARDIAKQLGVTLRRNVDPRGCALMLVLPTGETNDFNSEGWVI